MPVKRRVAKVRDHRITPEAVAAFRAGDVAGLYKALRLKPWEHSPIEMEDDEERPAWIAAEAWEKAKALRAELQAHG